MTGDPYRQPAPKGATSPPRKRIRFRYLENPEHRGRVVFGRALGVLLVMVAIGTVWAVVRGYFLDDSPSDYRPSDRDRWW
jgi:hypothetical protein